MSDIDISHAPIAQLNPAVQFDLVEVVSVLWKAKARIILLALLGLALGLYIAFALPRQFTAQGEVVVRAEALLAPDTDRAFNATAVNEAVVATERSVLAADGLLSRVSEQVEFPPGILSPGWLTVQVNRLRAALHLPPAVSADPAQEAAASRLAYLKKAVGTGVEKGSSVIAVVASTPNPAFSAAIVNRVLDDYMADRVVAQKGVAHNVEVSLQERLKQTTDQIQSTQERIAALMQQPGLIEGTEIPGQQRDLATVSNQLTEARRDVAEKQAAYDSAVQLRNKAGGDPARMGELLDNGSQSASDIRRQYSAKRQELAGLMARLGPGYPNVAVVRSEVNSLAARMSGEAMRVVAQRKAALDAANQVLAALKTQFGSVRSTNMRDTNGVLHLQRERDTLANLQRIAGTIEDRLITIASQPVDPNARILTAAVTPLVAAFPNKPLIGVVGFVGGLVLSSVVVLVGAFRRRLRRSVASQAAMFAGPLLACVPLLPSKRKASIGFLADLGRALQTKPDRPSLAFDGAALELDATLRRQMHTVVTITSALPQEGKTTVAMALAIRLARLDRKVLLINCDLHRADSRHRSSGKAASPGDDRNLDIVQPADNLHVLDLRAVDLRAVDTPTSFLQSRRFREIIDFARREYDVVLCDTPPALSVPDPLVVARLADTVLLVSEFKHKEDAAEVIELSRRIETTGKPVCGVVLTKVEPEDAGYAAYLGYDPEPQRRLAVTFAR